MTLIQATKIIGLKVLTLQTGKEIETVKDVIYDPEQNRVRALLIDKQGWFKDAKIIGIEKVISIGKDAVIVQDEDAIEVVTENSERVANIANDKNYLTKTKIVTSGGDDLGNISDLYFSLPFGNVIEFEVSGGIINDLKSGRNTIAVSDIITIGQDATIVKSYTAVKIDEQNKTQGAQGVATGAAGIAGMIGDKAKEAWEITKTKAEEAREYVESGKLKSDTSNVVDNVKNKAQEIKEDLAPHAKNLKDKAQDVGSDLKDKAQEVGSNIKNFAQEKSDEAKHATQDVTQGVIKNEALGQYLKINILDKNNEIIGSIGDIVTIEILDQAEKNDQLNKLLFNISKEPVNL